MYGDFPKLGTYVDSACGKLPPLQPEIIMADPKLQDPKTVEVKAEIPKKVERVTPTPVGSPMLHLHLNQWIDGKNDFPSDDSFIQVQIEAGKLKL